MKLRPAEPLPVVEAESVEEDDDDDFFGLGSDDDDDDDEEGERPSFNSVPDASGVSETQESDDDDDDDDILGFSALLDIFTGEDDTATKRPKITTTAPSLEFTIPILSRPTTPPSLENHELSTFPTESENNEEHEDGTEEPGKVVEENTGLTESNTESNTDENQEQITEASNKITYLVKPNKATINKVKKGIVGQKKPSVTSTSVNAIHDPEKPAKKPIKDEYDEDVNEDDILDDDDDVLDDDDDDEEVLDDDDDDKNDEDKLDDEKHTEHENEDDDDDDDDDEKAEDLAELDDDDEDEEEDAMLSALMETGKSKKTKGNQTNTNEHDNEDYDAELDFLTRKHSERNRQSKVTRV